MVNFASLSADQTEDLKTRFVQSFPKDRKYNLIYMDCPLSYNISYEKHKPKTRSPTFEFEDIRDLPVGDIADKDSILLLWSSCAQLERVMSLAKHWGFQFVTVWKVLRLVHNTQQGQIPAIVPGWWSLSNHQVLLLFKKGKVSKFKNPLTKGKELQEHISDKPRVSSKPDELRERI